MARPLAISLLVTLPETAPVVVLVRVERSVGPRVALVGFPVVAMPHGVVATAIASVLDAFFVAGVEAAGERRLLGSARGTLREHGALLAPSRRYLRLLAVVAGPVTVGEAGAVSVARP